MKNDQISESTIARIAGNLLSGMDREQSSKNDLAAVSWAVMMARHIAAEVVATRPQTEDRT